MPPGKNHLVAAQGGEAATKMCHGHLGRAPSRAGRPWHIAGRTLFGPTHGGEIFAKKTRIYGIAMQTPAFEVCGSSLRSSIFGEKNRGSQQRRSALRSLLPFAFWLLIFFSGSAAPPFGVDPWRYVSVLFS